MRVSQWLCVPGDAPPSDTVRALRRSWKFAATCQFLLLFEDQLGVAPFQTQRLESALDSRDSYVDTLAESLARLLVRPRGTPAGGLDDMLQLQYSMRNLTVEPWASMTALERVDVLHSLCEWHLELPDRLRRDMTDDETVSWRVNPAGWDRTGNTYWLFDDNRLWVQRPRPIPVKPKKKPARKRARASVTRRSTRVTRPEQYFSSDSELSSLSEDEPEGEWIEYETICITRADWESFAARFATSKHPDERSLYKYVNGEVLPRVVDAISEDESRAALERALSNRKRSSRIAVKESEREERERIEAAERSRIAREKAERAAAAEKAEREAAEFYAKHSRELRLREREERLREREERVRWRRESRFAGSEPRDEPMGESVEQATPDPTTETPRTDSLPPATVAPQPAPNATQSSVPSAPPAQVTPTATSVPFTNAPASASVPFAANIATVPPAFPVPAAAPPAELTPHASTIPSAPFPTSAAMTPPIAPVGTPLRASPTAGPAHLTPPRVRTPTGSFPLRTQTSRSPLSRAYEPMDEPSEFSLGSSNN